MPPKKSINTMKNSGSRRRMDDDDEENLDYVKISNVPGRSQMTENVSAHLTADTRDVVGRSLNKVEVDIMVFLVMPTSIDAKVSINVGDDQIPICHLETAYHGYQNIFYRCNYSFDVGKYLRGIQVAYQRDKYTWVNENNRYRNFEVKSGSKKLLAFVVPDKFDKVISYTNSIYDELEIINTSRRAIGLIGNYYKNLSPIEYLEFFQDPPLLVNKFHKFRGSHFSASLLLNLMNDGVKSDLSPELFLKWIILVECCSKLTPNASNDTADIGTGSLEHFSPKSILNFINLYILDNYLFLRIVVQFLSNIIRKNLNTSYFIDWAILILTIKQDMYAVQFIQRNPQAFSERLGDYIHFVTDPILRRNLIECSPKLFPLRELDLNMIDFDVLKKIVSSRTYITPNDWNSFDEEYTTFLTYAENYPRLFHYMFDRRLFFPNSEALSNLSLEDLFLNIFIRLALIYTDELPINYINSFIDKIMKNLDNDDAKSCESFWRFIYERLDCLLGLSDNNNKSASALISALQKQPKLFTIGNVLRHRLIFFIRETSDRIIQSEEIAIFDHLRNLTAEELIGTRKFVGNYLMKTNAIETSKTFVSLLSFLWITIFDKLKLVRSSLTERQSEIFRSVITGHDSNYFESLLDNENFLILHNFIITDRSNWERGKYWEAFINNQSYFEILSEFNNTEMAINNFFHVLEHHNVLPNVIRAIDKNEQLKLRLVSINSNFDMKRVINSAMERINEVIERWNILLSVYRDHMPNHPRFVQLSTNGENNINQSIHGLESTVVSSWISPHFHNQNIPELFVKLNKAQNSFLYRWIWNKQVEIEIENPIVDDITAAFELWILSIEESFERLQSFITNLTSSSPRSYIPEGLLSAAILLEGPALPIFPQLKLDALGMKDGYFNDLNIYRTQRVEIEMEIIRDVLPIRLEENRIVEIKEILLKYLIAISIQDQLKSLTQLSIKMNCNIDTNCSIVQLLNIFENETSEFGQIINAVNDLSLVNPYSLKIIDRFTEDLNLLIDEGLIDLFVSTSSIGQMNQAISRVLNECDERDAEPLQALLKFRIALDDEYYAFFQGRSFNHMPQLCEYIAQNSWCYRDASILVGRLSYLKEMIDGNNSTIPTITKVTRLLEVGSFKISLPGGIISASIPKEFEISPTDLEDFPTLLCFSSGNDDEGRLAIQEKYLEIADLVKEVSKVLVELELAGHPKYQSRQTNIIASANPEDIKGLVAKSSQELEVWEAFVSQSDLNLPLLSCLSRKQFAKVLYQIRYPNQHSSIASIILTIYPVLSLESCVSIVTNASSEVPRDCQNLKVLFRCIHTILLEGFSKAFPRSPSGAKYIMAKNQFLGILPDKLKTLNDVSVLSFENEHVHNEVLCSLYFALRDRLPIPMEAFVCSNNSTEIEVMDFLRRWTVSKSIEALDSSPSANKLLFCMSNIERLSLKIQNLVLKKIHVIRSKPCSPLILIVSQGKNADNVLSSGLRNDLVGDVQQIAIKCGGFLKTFLEQKAKKNVFICKSESPSSGKTTHIIRTCVNENPYASVPITGDISFACQVLSSVENDRQIAGDIPITLQLNVSNKLSVALLNQFFFKYLILGVITDSLGNSVLKRDSDTIAIEWPSEGYISSNSWKSCGILSCFEQIAPPSTILFEKLIFFPLENTQTLYKVVSTNDPNFEIGANMAVSYFTSRNSVDKYKALNQLDLPIQDDFDLFSYFRLELKEPKISQGQIFRFARFFCIQLFGLRNCTYYFLSNSDEQPPHYDGYPVGEVQLFHRRFCFYLAGFVFDLAINLAKSSVMPLTENYYDDYRLSNLSFSFENWSTATPFVFFTEDDYEFISTSETDIFSLIKKTLAIDDVNFTRYLDINKNYLDQNSIHIKTCCRDLCEEYDLQVHSRQDTNSPHPLKKLIPLISYGNNNFGRGIFDALELICKDVIPINASITVLREKRPSAVEELEFAINKNNKFPADFTVRNFVYKVKEWLKSISGSFDDENCPPFVLTIDNLIRLLATKLRLMCDIPVVFIGETGNGKTYSISFFSKISVSGFAIINIHGGITPFDLMKDIMNVIDDAKGRNLVILLDEINSMDEVWIIKEVVCDRIILGRRINENVRFICVMNPRRKKTEAKEYIGLDYSPYQKNRSEVNKEDLLVYDINQVPETLMTLAWDFGIPCDSVKSFEEVKDFTKDRTFQNKTPIRFTEETLFLESCVHWMISSKLPTYFAGSVRNNSGLMSDFRSCGQNDGYTYLKFFRLLTSSLISESQLFFRNPDLFDSCSVSLRDISRVVNTIPFMMQFQQKYLECYPLEADHQFLYFRFLDKALKAALVQDYGLRLNAKLRIEYFDKIRTTWSHVRRTYAYASSIADIFLPTPETSKEIYEDYSDLARNLCNCLLLDEGMASNEALKENTMSLFVTIMSSEEHGGAQLIVGLPGSSKSSSLEVLCSSTDPNCVDSRTILFKKYPHVRKFVIQCTPDTKASSILNLARRAAKTQLLNPLDRCVIVLEEVGVTVGSIHNPLMVLHGLVDRGILMEDGKYIKIPIIGISNWRLDGSKMSRNRITYRGNPSVDDLVKTATCIMQNNGAQVIGQITLKRFAEVFHDFALDKESTDENIRYLGWFYGMRDFYSFVQMLQIHTTISLAQEENLIVPTIHPKLGSHLVKWAIHVNLGGHPSRLLEKQFHDEVFQAFFPQPNVIQQSIWIKVENSTKIDFCDHCARIERYSIGTPVLTKRNTNLVCFEPNSKVLGRCVAYDVANEFPVQKVMSYCLKVLPPKLADIFRLRHVLLFTLSTAGLNLLFSLKIIRKEESAIIFGRSEATERDTLDDLMKIKRCMIHGQTLVLVKASHLYESILDAMNQHYTAEGMGTNRRYFTKLTINGITTTFPISPKFRCVVIEQLVHDLQKHLLPPFLNRFSKIHLYYSSALTTSQTNLSDQLKSSFGINKNDSIGILDFLIPGADSETIDSLVFSYYPTENVINIKNFLDQRDNARERLAYIIPPRRILQLKYGLLGNKKNVNFSMEVDDWLKLVDSRDYSLMEDLNLLSNIEHEFDGAIQSEDNNLFTHLLIMTEQRQFNSNLFSEKIQSLFPGSQPSSKGLIDLNKYTTETDWIPALKQLQRATTSSYIVAVFDSLLSSNAKYVVEKFMFVVDNFQLSTHSHVILVAFSINSSRPCSYSNGFSIAYSTKWTFLFTDELSVPPDDIDKPLKELFSSSLDEILQNDYFFSQVVCSKALSIAQRLKRRREDIEILREEILLVFQDYDIVRLIRNRVLLNMKDLAVTQTEDWKAIALKNISFSESLRMHLITFIKEFVERILLEYSDVLFPFNNLNLLRTDSAKQLLLSEVIVRGQDLSNCINVNILSSINNDRVSLFSKSDKRILYPFSHLLAEELHPLAVSQGKEKVLEKVNELLGDELKNVGVFDYITDIATHVIGIHDEVAPIFIQILIALEKELTFALPHELLINDTIWLDSVVRFLNDDERLKYIVTDILTSENISTKLLEMCPKPYSMENIMDIKIILSSKDLIWDLLGCVALLTKNESHQVREEAFDFINNHRLRGSSKKDIAGSIGRENPISLEMSKFIISILFEDIMEDEELILLNEIISKISLNFKDYPRSTVSFVINRAIKFWVNSDDVNNGSFFGLEKMIEIFDIDSDSIVLISRCVHDFCIASSTKVVIRFKDKINKTKKRKLDENTVIFFRDIIESGIETASLTLISEFVQHQLGLLEDETISEVNAQELKLMLDNMLIEDRKVDRAGLFLLRVLSSGGTEMEICKEACRLANSNIPQRILESNLVVSLYSNKNDVSVMSIFDKYNEAFATFQRLIAMADRTNDVDETIAQFNILPLSAKVSVLLEELYINEAQVLSNNAIDIVHRLISEFNNQDVSELTTRLIFTRPEQQWTRKFSSDIKSLWVVICLSILTSETSACTFLSDQIIRNGSLMSLPIQNRNAPNRGSINVTRIVMSSLGMLHSLLRDRPAAPEDIVNGFHKTIIEDILTTKCPGCRGAFDAFDGCFSVTCVRPNCNTCFCAWCFTVFPDAHAHVPLCPRSLEPGAIHSRQDLFDESCRRDKALKLRQLFDEMNPEYKSAVADAAMQDITAHQISLDSFGVSVGYSPVIGLRTIERALDDLKIQYFSNAATSKPVTNWISCLMMTRFRTSLIELTSINDVTDFVTHSISEDESPAKLLQDTQDLLKKDNFSLYSMLSWNDQYEAEIKNLEPEEINQRLPHHYALRTLISMETFWETVEMNSELHLLKFLHDNEESLEREYIIAVLQVIAYVRHLMKYGQLHQVTREVASKLTVGEVGDLGPFPLNSVLQSIQLLYDKLDRQNCKTKEEHFNQRYRHLIPFNNSLPIIYLLPSDEDEGMFLKILLFSTSNDGITWKSLGYIQNDVVKFYKKYTNNSYEPRKLKRIYDLNQNLAVEFDIKKHIYDRLDLFIEPSSQPTFVDLSNLQLLIIHETKINQKVLIPTFEEFEIFIFSEDQRQTVFGKLSNRIGKMDLLEGILLDSINDAINNCGGFRTSCLAYLTILAVEIVSNTKILDSKLFDLNSFIAIPLTAEQEQGKTFLSSQRFKRELQTSHMLPLIAALWNGEVILKACRVLSNDEEEECDLYFKSIRDDPIMRLDGPQLLMRFKLLGIRVLSGFQSDEFLAAPLSYSLDAIMDERIFSLNEGLLGRLQLNQFKSVFTIAEAVLSKIQLTETDENIENNHHASEFDIQIPELLFSNDGEPDHQRTEPKNAEEVKCVTNLEEDIGANQHESTAANAAEDSNKDQPYSWDDNDWEDLQFEID